MDIFILYGRIQMLSSKLELFSKVSVYKIAIIIVIFSMIVNIPINLGRQVIKVPFRIESNVTSVLEAYGKI